MKQIQFRNELENLTQNFVNPSNEGYEINYTSSQKDQAKKEFESIKSAGFNATLKGRKFMTIEVKMNTVRKHGLRVIEVSK